MVREKYSCKNYKKEVHFLFNKVIMDSIISYADIIVEEYDSPPAFMSIAGYKNEVRAFCNKIRKSGTLSVVKNKTRRKEYSVRAKTYSPPRIHREDNLAHACIFKEDEIIESKSGDESLRAYIYITEDFSFDVNEIRRTDFDLLEEKIYSDIPEELLGKIYDKLHRNTPVPLLRDWMGYITYRLIVMRRLSELAVTKPENSTFRAFRITVSVEALFNIVTEGLISGDIAINGNTEPSQEVMNVEGLDSYLNTFKEVLAEKIQSNFTPRFDPRYDKYSRKMHIFDEYSKAKGSGLYEAQKGVAEAVSRTLKEQDVCFIVGEMGVGSESSLNSLPSWVEIPGMISADPSKEVLRGQLEPKAGRKNPVRCND